MRIILAGGGTGGHLYPALALARYFKNELPGTEVLFIGTEEGMEKNLVPQEGFELKTIKVTGLPRKLSIKMGQAFFKLAGASVECKKIINSFKPDVVIGMGGYVSFPMVFVSSLSNIPTLIHEQNAIPGVSNKVLYNFASKVCLSFSESEKYFKHKKKLVVTGNPRASEVVMLDKEVEKNKLGLDSNKKVLLIVGGSQGALMLNEAVVNALDFFSISEHQLIYITGKRYYEDIKTRLEQKNILVNKNINVFPYFSEMPSAMAAADLIITRAGATTLAEITSIGLPSILVPSPNVTNNHQFINAKLLADRGGAVLMEENELTSEKLAEVTLNLLKNEIRLTKMKNKCKDIGVPHSTRLFKNCIQELLR